MNLKVPLALNYQKFSKREGKIVYFKDTNKLAEISGALWDTTVSKQ